MWHAFVYKQKLVLVELVIPCEYNSVYGISIPELWHIYYVCGSLFP